MIPISVTDENQFDNATISQYNYTNDEIRLRRTGLRRDTVGCRTQRIDMRKVKS